MWEDGTDPSLCSHRVMNPTPERDAAGDGDLDIRIIVAKDHGQIQDVVRVVVAESDEHVVVLLELLDYTPESSLNARYQKRLCHPHEMSS